MMGYRAREMDVASKRETEPEPDKDKEAQGVAGGRGAQRPMPKTISQALQRILP